ncbi:GNAT family N-acetyltransferase [Nonomuraea jabiensis]|uniref:Mycothiol synthase n=1 Tax=Nonomuraea jabiensis TaxID=882448 RepID=A0A7W9FXZ0_9ACTN|nr:GNAT family N-acetyltransferase [Nonomuraea jabiensis]MBB5773571.1 mycothiol synthase [Nonomuraea jabiensis]
MDLLWRPLRSSDVPVWADFLGQVEAVDHKGENYSLTDLRDQLADPRVDLEAATVAAFDGSDLAGYGIIRFRPEAAATLVAGMEGAVAPRYRRRGLGQRLVEWFAQQAALVQRRDYPDRTLELRVHASERNEGQAALMAATGFDPVRWLLDMERRLDNDIDLVAAPDGMSVVPFDSRPAEAVLKARNDAFSGQWGNSSLSPEVWHGLVTASAFRPELSFLATEGERVTGVLLAHYYPADTEVTGVKEAWIHSLGTIRAARGRGVASALLSHALAAYRALGYERASLSVDSAGPAAALRVYEQTGFAIAHRWTVFGRG